MATTRQNIMNLYQQTITSISANSKNWTDFLASACRNYKCRFDEQVLIYAQRQDAVAVLEMKDWNDKFGRWVKSGSKGIAVLAADGNKLKYYFDISDTQLHTAARSVPIWEMQEQYSPTVIKQMSEAFGGFQTSDIKVALLKTAHTLVHERMEEFIADLQAYTVEVDTDKFKTLVENSIAYMLFKRCSFDADQYIDVERFADITQFQDSFLLNAVGVAANKAVKEALKEITIGIKQTQKTIAADQSIEYNQDKIPSMERGTDNERDHIQQAGRIFNSGSGVREYGRSTDREIRTDALGLSAGNQTSNLHGIIDDRSARSLLESNRTESPTANEADNRSIGTDSGRDGTTEREKSDGMDRSDEQYSQSGRTNDNDGTDLQLNFPTVTQQLESIQEAEAEQASAFVLSQEDIDSTLTCGGGGYSYKNRIVQQIKKEEGSSKNIEILKKIYGTGGGTHYFPDGSSGFVSYNPKGFQISKTGCPDLRISWAKTEKRITELIKNNRYFNEDEVKVYPEFLIYDAKLKENAEKRNFINESRDLPLHKKRNTLALRLSDFINVLDHYEKNFLDDVGRSELKNVTKKQMDLLLQEPTTVQQLINFLSTIQWKTANLFSRANAWGFIKELGELFPRQYIYQTGDIVYLSDNSYEVMEVTDDFVSLQNLEFPLLGKEYSKAELHELLRQIDSNDKYLQIIVNNQETIPSTKGIRTESEEYTSSEEAEKVLHSHRPTAKKIIELSEPVKVPDDAELIGEKITIDNRQYVIERIDTLSNDVSLRDVTFQNSVGFPISRMEKLSRVREWLDAKEKEPELAAKQNTELEAVYPAVENGLPYDIVVEKMQFDEPEQKLSVNPPAYPDERKNFRITDDTLGIGGAKEKFKANMAAIHLLHDLEIENRLATPEEQAVLSKYVGWGGLSEAFSDHSRTWNNEHELLLNSLSPAEYRSAMESTLTAFYTPPVVVKAMYEVLDKLGFKQGNLFDPGCGTGMFFGLLPEDMKRSKLYGTEIDSVSGRIAQQLYQTAQIAVEGFEKTKLPDNHFDVVFGNVPFGDIRVNDKRYADKNFLIHDYFFAKALDKVRTGGIVMFVTSKGTMDKANPQVRKYIAQRAELLGAIRLPDNTFYSNAGTRVTSDILILQKRDRVIDVEPDWVFLDVDSNNVSMNSYFITHPDMVLGNMVMESSQFGMSSACKAKEGCTLSNQLSYAVQQIKGTVSHYELDDISAETEQAEIIAADPDVKNFSFGIIDEQVYFRQDDQMIPVDASNTVKARIKGLVQIRDCTRRLINYQMNDYPDELIHSEQEKLNQFYDAFIKKHGLINHRGNYQAFQDDESYYLLCSLEILDEDGNFKRKADMFSKRTINPHREILSVETANDALALSIGEKARVDLPYMAQLTGKTREELVRELSGLVFKLPDTEPAQYVMADEYLSGNVRLKLASAERAAKNDTEFTVNVEALKKVQPEDLSASEISVRLGTTWIPEDDIQQFIMETIQPSSYAANRIKVNFSNITGNWYIENKSADRSSVKATSTFGTHRASAYEIIENTLNLKDVRIFDYIPDENNKPQAVLNNKETAAAQAKQETIKQAFQDWIWKDSTRRSRLVRYYNDTFNSIRPREYDGRHIKFVGMNPEITLRPHQVNAIARMLYGGNTLLAHKVGAGKTYEMVAAAQEGKRLGLCNKSMIVVPNHLVGQWAVEYLQLYPSANILVTGKKEFEKIKRKKFSARIATGDFDAVIIGHSQFEKIPVSIERQVKQLEQQLDEIEQGLTDASASAGENFTVKQLIKSRKAIELKLEKLNSTEQKDKVIDFEELGIDRLFVDESHNYKNLYFYTKLRNVGGIAQTEAKKSSDLFAKCRYLDELTGNYGIVFATGTPISNSMVEMYSLQRYLQYDLLIKQGFRHFDSWASTFGETVTALELSPDGTKYRMKTRFAKFYNLPELMHMFRETADIQTADTLKLPVPKVETHNIKTKPSRIQKEYVKSLAERAERIHAKLVDSSVDNMLKVTNDGRKLALDQRLIDPLLPNDPESKVNACAENVYRLWEEYSSDKAAQLVFCDLSTPKKPFHIEMQEVNGVYEMVPVQFSNIYDELKILLIQRGIPEKEIQYIHDAKSDAKKKELFAKVRSGEVRVLIGSTQKMGAGTNVQDRLIALHNLDCPWRPSDLEQRLGRGERQGNMFPVLHNFRYVTEGTFDAYLYQLVESKQKYISQIMTSRVPLRVAEDVDEVALSFAEVKMLATGDPRFKEKMDLDIRLSKLKMLKQSYLSDHYYLEDQVITYYPSEIKLLQEEIAGYKSDALIVEKNKPQDEKIYCGITLNGVTYLERADAGKELLLICKTSTPEHPEEIGSYRGFRLEHFYDTINMEHRVYICGSNKYPVSLGFDASGNLTRIDNELSRIPMKLMEAKSNLQDLFTQMDNAKKELNVPFSYEEELETKSERINQLNAELNLDEPESIFMDEVQNEVEPDELVEELECDEEYEM